MSVEEHIKYYATMKGIPSSKRSQIIEQTISELGL
jgi:ABC-type multidrug transport system ATPase subunit